MRKSICLHYLKLALISKIKILYFMISLGKAYPKVKKQFSTLPHSLSHWANHFHLAISQIFLKKNRQLASFSSKLQQLFRQNPKRLKHKWRRLIYVKQLFLSSLKANSLAFWKAKEHSYKILRYTNFNQSLSYVNALCLGLQQINCVQCFMGIAATKQVLCQSQADFRTIDIIVEQHIEHSTELKN